MGVSVTEGVIAKWYVDVGDRVTNEQIVCEISTDKTDAEILAPADGVITEIIVFEGDAVDVGNPVARMSVGSATLISVHAATNEISIPEMTAGAPPTRLTPETTLEPRVLISAVAASKTPSEFTSDARSVSEMLAGASVDPEGAADAVLGHPSNDGRPLSSPLAQRRAKERNIDLRTIRGTGRRGRICVQDVLAADRANQAIAQASVAPKVTGDSSAMPVGYEDVPFEVATTSPHRRAISEHMIRSRQTAAHMTTEVDVDMFHVSKVRDMMNAARGAVGQGRISYLSFISKAAVFGLAEFPDMNATFQHERIIHWTEVNLGIAVDTPAGLIVPVIRRVEAMTVENIADSITTVAERARARRLAPDDLRAGTFTISNPGSVGAVSAPAIINQPQVAILGIPVIVRRPWVVNSPEGSEAVAIRPILRLAVTFDHRAIDGAYATRYVARVREYLETWDLRDYS
jgi:2-oxoglutarate dehydrogenase E2 component (dihydrolipoamide succinyltransferase)